MSLRLRGVLPLPWAEHSFSQEDVPWDWFVYLLGRERRVGMLRAAAWSRDFVFNVGCAR